MKLLSDIDDGVLVRVIELKGGRKFQAKMSDLGVLKGGQILMFKNSNEGAIIIKVKESRLSMGTGMAQKILVEEV